MLVGGGAVRPPSRRALVVSLVAHGLFGAVLVEVLLLPLPFSDFMRKERVETAPVERINFVVTPTPGANTSPGKTGGNGRPVTHTLPPPLIAPPDVPSALPAAPPSPAHADADPDAGAGTGPVVGVGGPAEGARPEYHDPRVWVPPAPMLSSPKTMEESVDSVLAARVQAHNDTLALGAGRRQPGDWTFEHNGKKYGVDPKYIRLGPISIPTAVLAFLPLNVTANPILGANERTLTARHDDIMFQAQRSLNEDEFRDAVKHLRQRKEKERDEATKKSEPPPPPDKPKDGDNPPAVVQ
jgi:hypothetical protein